MAARLVLPRIVVVRSKRLTGAAGALSACEGGAVDGIAAGVSGIALGEAAPDRAGASTAALPGTADAPSFALKTAGIQKQNPSTKNAIHAVLLSPKTRTRAVAGAEAAIGSTATFPGDGTAKTRAARFRTSQVNSATGLTAVASNPASWEPATKAEPAS
jgi:hypothetical protein